MEPKGCLFIMQIPGFSLAVIKTWDQKQLMVEGIDLGPIVLGKV